MRRKDKQKLLYIAGPYRDTRGEYYVELNRHRAKTVALELWRRGFAVITPHLNAGMLAGALPDSVWLQGDLTIMARCDGIVLLPQWRASPGAREELRLALRLKMAVHEWPMTHAEWPITNAERVSLCPTDPAGLRKLRAFLKVSKSSKGKAPTSSTARKSSKSSASRGAGRNS